MCRVWCWHYRRRTGNAARGLIQVDVFNNNFIGEIVRPADRFLVGGPFVLIHSRCLMLLVPLQVSLSLQAEQPAPKPF